MTVRFSVSRWQIVFSFLLFHPTCVHVPLVVLFFRTGHSLLVVNISFAALTDTDHHHHNESVQKTSRSAQIPPLLSSMPRSSLVREPSLTSSTFSDGNQDPPLLCLADDGLPSPIQPSFKYSARHPPEAPPNTSYRSPSENNLGRRDVRNPPSLDSPGTYLHKEGFSIDRICRGTDATGYTDHNEGSDEVGLEGSVETEIDGILDELMDYHSEKRSTTTSVHLLPLPEELSPTDGPLNSQPHVDHFLPPLLTVDTSYSGDSDTPSLTPSSPRGSEGSYLSSTSPSLKSKRSFTLITPSIDGWRSLPTLAAATERRAPTSNYFDYTKVPRRPGVWSHDPRQAPEDLIRDGHPSTPSRNRRSRPTNPPPLRMTIPEDSIIRRRAKSSTPSEYTSTRDRGHRVETSVDSVSSYFSDDGASEITEIGSTDSGFDPAYLSASSTVSPQFTGSHPRLDASRGSGSSHHSGHSPSPSPSPGSINYPLPSNNRHTPSPKRGMLQSLFSQSGASERKKERKWAKTQDPIQTQSLYARSMDAVSLSTTSSKSSKKADKAAKRAQLAAQFSAKKLPQAEDKSRGGAPQKGSTTWEESGAMYSMDGIF